MQHRGQHWELQKLYPLVVNQLSTIPGVRGVGIGFREKNGMITNEPAWKIYTCRKKKPGELLTSELIPAFIFNIRTDVVEHSSSKLTCGDNGYKSILTPGIQISNESGGQGTLGCFARLRSGGQTVLLSNKHVLYNGGRGANANIGQPSVTCSSCNNCGTIANNIGNGSNGLGTTSTQVIDGVTFTIGTMDAGIATLNNTRRFTNVIPGIGMITGTPPPGQLGVVLSSNPLAPNPDSLVRKVGIQTALTLGQVVQLDFLGPVFDGTGHSNMGLTHQLLVMPRRSASGPVGNGINFVEQGDSGSVVVNRLNQVIGLLSFETQIPAAVLAPLGLPTDLGNFGLVTPIERILTQLNIEIPPDYRSPGTTHGEIMDITEANRYDLISPSMFIKKIKNKTAEGITGKDLVQTIERHEKEIGELVNKNRATTVTWHRNFGVTWVAHFLNSVKDPEYRLPQQVKGVTKKDFLINMATVLKENGSADLASDISKYEPLVYSFINEIDSVSAFIAKINNEKQVTDIANTQ